jgi:hypothetical protein
VRPTLCEPEVHGRRSSAVRILYAAVTRGPVG